MGQGYRHVPQGIPRFVAETKGLRKQVDSLRTAASLNNSAVTSGSGITVQAPNGQAIQLLVTPDNISSILFTPPSVSQVDDWAAQVNFKPDGSYGGGSIQIASPLTPHFGNPTPKALAAISLNSGDGASQNAAINFSIQSPTGITMAIVDAIPGVFQSRIQLGSGWIEDDSFSGASWRLFAGLASLVFPYTVAEARIRDNANSAYVPIRASAFTVTSTIEAKQDVRSLGWDPVQVVRDAQAKQWRYKPEHADPDRVHFGPMVEDLPEELVDRTDPDEPSLSISDLLGVAWAAIGSLAARVEELERAAAQRDA